MAIPKEILALKPINTRVKKTSDPNVYTVIKRTCEMRNGKPVPKELGVVGKIINGIYVPVKEEKYFNTLEYGNIMVINRIILKRYPKLDLNKQSNLKYLSILILKNLYPDLNIDEIDDYYHMTYLCYLYKDLTLKKNTIKNLSDYELFSDKELCVYFNSFNISYDLLNDNINHSNNILYTYYQKGENINSNHYIKELNYKKLDDLKLIKITNNVYGNKVCINNIYYYIIKANKNYYFKSSENLSLNEVFKLIRVFIWLKANKLKYEAYSFSNNILNDCLLIDYELNKLDSDIWSLKRRLSKYYKQKTSNGFKDLVYSDSIKKKFNDILRLI